MPPVLECLTGKHARQKFPLDKPESRIGRHPECEIAVDNNSVSRFHARIVPRDGKFLIEDLKSRNGTLVNSKAIEAPTALVDGDRVKICDILFVFRSGDAPKKIAPVMENPLGVADEGDAPSTVLTSLDAQSSADDIVKVNPEAKLKAILEITAALGSTLDLGDLYPKILDTLFKIFPQADRGLIILVDPSGAFVPRAAKHRKASQDTIRFSKTVVKHALDNKQAVLSSDAGADERFSLAQSIADFKIRSIMCVPLITAEKESVGVIQLDTASMFQKFTQDDLALLAGVATQIANAIANARAHESILSKQKIDRELQFAREIQTGFLPKSLPPLGGYEFWAFYQAAGMVGGDYYDVVRLPGGRMAVLLGDVSGKGVPAALFMAKVTSDARVSLLTHPDNPATAMTNINNLVCAAGLADKFITIALCLLEPGADSMTIVNGGHMSPIVRRRDGKLDEPAGEAVTGLPIGVMEEYDYESVASELAVGESFILYSDGISEAMNKDNDLYTIERLKEIITPRDLGPKELGEAIIEDVRKHVAGHAQSDDMTLMVVRRTA